VTSSSSSIPVGTLLGGKLRIVRLLGKGGMRSVYEVEHEFTKHRRALKLLHPEMLSHPNVVERFLREASAAGRIGNLHVTESFDAGKLDTGHPYLLMELLDGETLHARLSRLGPLPVEEIADLIGQACDGVQAAHDAGIVHRDLKPENLVRIERDGKALVKILDFGISKFDPDLTGAHAVTREGSALGTPFYMSPEQIEGEKDLDARTDIYALGVILYECASGRRPFEADAIPKLSLLIHQARPTPLTELRPELPPGFVALVERAMAKDRDKRPQTAKELAESLARFGSAWLGATMQDAAPMVSPSQLPPKAHSEPPVSLGDTPAIGAGGKAAGSGSPSKSNRPPRGDVAMQASIAGSAISVAREPRRNMVPIIAGVVAVAALVVGYELRRPGSADDSPRPDEKTSARLATAPSLSADTPKPPLAPTQAGTAPSAPTTLSPAPPDTPVVVAADAGSPPRPQPRPGVPAPSAVAPRTRPSATASAGSPAEKIQLEQKNPFGGP
jgi:eukaryotic-like serine/threonine-protein kinase